MFLLPPPIIVIGLEALFWRAASVRVTDGRSAILGGRRETSLVAMLSRVICDGFLLTELRGIRCVCLLEDNPPWRHHRLSIFSPSSELHAFTLRLWHHVPFALEVLSPFLHTSLNVLKSACMRDCGQRGGMLTGRR